MVERKENWKFDLGVKGLRKMYLWPNKCHSLLLPLSELLIVSLLVWKFNLTGVGTWGRDMQFRLLNVKDTFWRNYSSLVTFYDWTSVCIFLILYSLRCWKGEIVQQPRTSLVGGHCLYSDNRNVWYKDDTLGGNNKLVTHKGWA